MKNTIVFFTALIVTSCITSKPKIYEKDSVLYAGKFPFKGSKKELLINMNCFCYSNDTLNNRTVILLKNNNNSIFFYQKEMTSPFWWRLIKVDHK